jgi:hypothetical protein
MEVVLPKADMGAQCITAVEVYANGATYPANQNDFVESCVEITAGSTYASVRDAIRGKFTLGMPDTGLGSLEIYGWNGPGGCNFDDNTPSPNLLFFGKAEYIGQDKIQLPLVPNVDCATQQVKIRMVDMMALVNGGTCATATTVGTQPFAEMGTLLPRNYGKGVDFYGGTDGANMQANLATFDAHTKIGVKTCIAVNGGSETGGSVGCNVGGGTVCAAAGETEHAYIPDDIYSAALTVDQAQLAKFPSAILGSVWSNAKTAVSGATVEVDSAHAKVYYVDPPAAGTSQLRVRTDNATGPSGLFLVYTDTLVSATIKTAAGTRTVTLGAPTAEVSASMIVMP